jgi:hypothetical protein
MTNQTVVAALFLTVGIVGATFMATNAAYKAAKNEAIGQCFEVATSENFDAGTRVVAASDTVDSTEERSWESRKTVVNEELLGNCISRKGY